MSKINYIAAERSGAQITLFENSGIQLKRQCSPHSVTHKLHRRNVSAKKQKFLSCKNKVLVLSRVVGCWGCQKKKEFAVGWGLLCSAAGSIISFTDSSWSSTNTNAAVLIGTNQTQSFLEIFQRDLILIFEAAGDGRRQRQRKLEQCENKRYVTNTTLKYLRLQPSSTTKSGFPFLSSPLIPRIKRFTSSRVM